MPRLTPITYAGIALSSAGLETSPENQHETVTLLTPQALAISFWSTPKRWISALSSTLSFAVNCGMCFCVVLFGELN